jgi:hypothetical protein
MAKGSRFLRKDPGDPTDFWICEGHCGKLKAGDQFPTDDSDPDYRRGECRWCRAIREGREAGRWDDTSKIFAKLSWAELVSWVGETDLNKPELTNRLLREELLKRGGTQGEYPQLREVI